ncbi:MAG TPA: signal peptidase I [Candidatus Methylomirabilis sp.]|nr:signal peptidase I [Candidatus Methylomirabilis sp.]
MKTKDILNICLYALILLPIIYIIPSIITGSTKLLIVLSGSMVPVMQVGDVAVVKHISPEDIRVKDIVAFKDPSGKTNITITHRVTDIRRSENLSFHTKGDALEESDSFIVKEEDIAGKMVFVIPSMGYFIDYVKKKKWISFFMLTILPSVFLAMEEFRKMIRSPALEHRAKREEKRKKRIRTILNTGRILLIFLIAIIISGTAVLFSAGNCVYTGTDGGISVENKGLLSCAFIFKTDKEDVFIPPVVLSENNNSIIKTQLKDDISISATPYILPVFWINALLDINPYFPILTILVLPPMLITLILYPAWIKKEGRNKKSLLRKLKRKFVGLV